MKRSASGMSLMLIELVIAICFFAVISAVCVKIFVTARVGETRSEEQNRAVVAAESAAECFKEAGGDIDTSAVLLGGRVENGVLFQSFDENWQQDGEEVYRLSIRPETGENGLRRAEISVEQAAEGRVIYTLEAAALEEAA